MSHLVAIWPNVDGKCVITDYCCAIAPSNIRSVLSVSVIYWALSSLSLYTSCAICVYAVVSMANFSCWHYWLCRLLLTRQAVNTLTLMSWDSQGEGFHTSGSDPPENWQLNVQKNCQRIAIFFSKIARKLPFFLENCQNLPFFKNFQITIV